MLLIEAVDHKLYCIVDYLYDNPIEPVRVESSSVVSGHFRRGSPVSLQHVRKPRSPDVLRWNVLPPFN
jgi:hypothetical protein